MRWQKSVFQVGIPCTSGVRKSRQTVKHWVTVCAKSLSEGAREVKGLVAA